MHEKVCELTAETLLLKHIKENKIVLFKYFNTKE